MMDAKCVGAALANMHTGFTDFDDLQFEIKDYIGDSLAGPLIFDWAKLLVSMMIKNTI